MNQPSQANNQPQAFFTACGGKIENPEKFPSAVYKGQLVYFCTEACLKAFTEKPDAFMTGEIEHPL